MCVSYLAQIMKTVISMTKMSLILYINRMALAFIWFYQGLVPKLLGPNHDELVMNMALGLSPLWATYLAYIGGVLELILGGVVFVFYRHAWPYQLTIAAMIGFLLLTIIWTPEFVTSAFNSVTVNLAIIALAMNALVCIESISCFDKKN